MGKMLTKSLLSQEKETSKYMVEKFKVQQLEDICFVCDGVVNLISENPYRQVALLREYGLLKVLCEKMKLFFNENVANEKVMLSFIDLCSKLIIGTAAAKEFVSYNGHGLILQLMKKSSNDTIIEALDLLTNDISELSSLAGCPFPTLSNIAILDEDEIACVPLVEYYFESISLLNTTQSQHVEHNLSGHLKALMNVSEVAPGRGEGQDIQKDTNINQLVNADEVLSHSNNCETKGEEDDDEAAWSVILQSITLAQECQFTVGYLMWPAAIILGRWIRFHFNIFEGLKQDAERAASTFVLHELGAGLGLSGLVAASSGMFTSLVLSDFNDVCVANLNENIMINGHGSSCKAISLDWTKIDQIMTMTTPQRSKPYSQNNTSATAADESCNHAAEKNSEEDYNDSLPDTTTTLAGIEKSDVIIASDVICQVSDAYMLAHTLKLLLKPSGLALIIIPVPGNRFGTEAFPSALKKENLLFEKHTIKSREYLCNIHEADFFTWNAFVVWGGFDESCDEKVVDVDTFMSQEKWHENFINSVRAM
jgi:predicted nicotinamide N-methyase